MVEGWLRKQVGGGSSQSGQWLSGKARKEMGGGSSWSGRWLGGGQSIHDATHSAGAGCEPAHALPRKLTGERRQVTSGTQAGRPTPPPHLQWRHAAQRQEAIWSQHWHRRLGRALRRSLYRLHLQPGSTHSKHSTRDEVMPLLPNDKEEGRWAMASTGVAEAAKWLGASCSCNCSCGVGRYRCFLASVYLRVVQQARQLLSAVQLCHLLGHAGCDVEVVEHHPVELLGGPAAGAGQRQESVMMKRRQAWDVLLRYKKVREGPLLNSEAAG